MYGEKDMGTNGKWRCRDCGNEFKASVGGGFHFILYRCVQCDRTKSVDVKRSSSGEWIPTDKSGVGVCQRCGGQLRDDINPMCRKCKSRNTEQLEIEVYYD